MSKHIVEAAREAGSFTTLLAAIDAAGLGETARGRRPVTADLEASNGAIHVIDRVLLPAAA